MGLHKRVEPKVVRGMLPPTPTQQQSVRMVTSYAGFVDESALLQGLVKRGLAGQHIGEDLYAQPGMIALS